ncbi:T9SS type A sorting domain-containing protein [candidate division KSB1 bacterium]|nr:T9SS type A sorting domain-containing protein [candidate division KSB1 bacterium]
MTCLQFSSQIYPESAYHHAAYLQIVEYPTFAESENGAPEVFDIRGRLVQTLEDGYKTPGVYRTTLNAKKLPTDVYFYRIRMKNFVAVKKMILLE